jgi:hypothetical protein
MHCKALVGADGKKRHMALLGYYIQFDLMIAETFHALTS